MNSTPVPGNDPAPYQQSGDSVLTSLSANPLSGLTQVEAKARLERYGPDELTAEEPMPWWKKFLAQFKDVLVILLLIATAIPELASAE